MHAGVWTIARSCAAVKPGKLRWLHGGNSLLYLFRWSHGRTNKSARDLTHLALASGGANRRRSISPNFHSQTILLPASLNIRRQLTNAFYAVLYFPIIIRHDKRRRAAFRPDKHRSAETLAAWPTRTAGVRSRITGAPPPHPRQSWVVALPRPAPTATARTTTPSSSNRSFF